MNINSFEEWDATNEMAHISGISTYDNNSKEHEWKPMYMNTAKLITDQLPGKQKLYVSGTHHFLTDKNDEYLGYIQLNNVTDSYKNILPSFGIKNVYQIGTSNQNGTVTGFYNIIFTAIFIHTDIACIMSDDNLSNNAVNSYERLYNGTNLNIFYYSQSNKKVAEFDKNEIMKRDDTVILTLPKDKVMLENRWNNYLRKITTNESYINEFKKSDTTTTLYMMLYTTYMGTQPLDEWC